MDFSLLAVVVVSGYFNCIGSWGKVGVCVAGGGGLPKCRAVQSFGC